MKTSIYTRHHYHSDIIKRAVWLYFRFNLSFRDVEELMAERGVDVSYETLRQWVDKFGCLYAKRLRAGSSLRKFRYQAQNQWDVVTASVCV